MWRQFAMAVFLLPLAALPVEAGQLSLDMLGVTAGGSSFAGQSIAAGTEYEIHAVFSPPPYSTGKGIGLYTVTRLAVNVGGTSYVPDLGSNSYTVYLIDPTSGLLGGNAYGTGLINDTNGTQFFPAYSTATPPISALDPDSTVFSGYIESSAYRLVIPTASGDLVLTYDSAPTTAVTPEPATLSLALLGGLAVGVLARRRGAR